MLPEEQRAEGFAILRVGMNLAAAVGPLLGGFIATRSYLGLFAADAVISLLAAGLVFGWLPETRPETTSVAEMGAESAGYGRVFRDASFMLFFGVCTLAWLTYVNLDTTLGVYLRDQHGLLPGGYGLILALNALMVLLLQFWVTRRAERYPPMLMMALGALLYGIGFGLYGVVSSYAAFLLAIAVATLGEMVTVPLSNALVANLAPADMRGRYNAVFGISWTIPYYDWTLPGRPGPGQLQPGLAMVRLRDHRRACRLRVCPAARADAALSAANSAGAGGLTRAPFEK